MAVVLELDARRSGENDFVSATKRIFYTLLLRGDTNLLKKT